MLALALEFSRCSEARTPRAEQCAPPTRRSSRSLPTANREYEIEIGELADGVASASTWSHPKTCTNDRLRSAKWLLRKEVIQPHLPVRLPCYDFTPIASPTFDGSLPKGLGHRLRVLPTFVV